MPKRKAVARISGLIDSDDEIVDTAAASQPDSHDEPPVKKARGRPKSSGAKLDEQPVAPRSQRTSSAGVTKQNASTTKKVAGRGRRPRTTTTGPEPIEENTEDEAQNNDDAEREDAHEEGATAEVSPIKKRRGRGRESESNAKQVTKDGEFEYTPTAPRQLKPTEALGEPAKGRPRQRRSEPVDETVVPDSQTPASVAADETESVDKRPNVISPLKSLTNGERPGRKRPTVTFADTEKTPTDPDLRRKLGDMTKKYETLEVKYRNLREIGVVEANANFEKIRKQCEHATNASNKLIEALKEELATQKALGKESRNLQKQLRDREKEVTGLQSQVGDLSTQLSTAQIEIKALQTKLAAARNNSVGTESLNTKIPGSASKTVASRNAAAGAAAEAAQAAHLAQLKEDLYSDLSGLIIRNVKKRESDYLYDCLQTGANGTLHFKLAVAHDGNGNVAVANFNGAEFHYMPLLDSNRDAELVKILPEYLAVDITFSRPNAAKFYTRVMDSLTKRRIDPDE